jgi:hypothetical protein
MYASYPMRTLFGRPSCGELLVSVRGPLAVGSRVPAVTAARVQPARCGTGRRPRRVLRCVSESSVAGCIAGPKRLTQYHPVKLVSTNG